MLYCSFLVPYGQGTVGWGRVLGPRNVRNALGGDWSATELTTKQFHATDVADVNECLINWDKGNLFGEVFGPLSAKSSIKMYM